MATELRRFNDRAKNALAELAWETACRFLSEKQEARPGIPLTVGLRGITLYDRVLAGIYTGDP